MSHLQIAMMVLVMGLITWGLRALPFFFKDWLNAHPFIAFIKSRFPLIMMFILVVYASEVYKARHWTDERLRTDPCRAGQDDRPLRARDLLSARFGD